MGNTFDLFLKTTWCALLCASVAFIGGASTFAQEAEIPEAPSITSETHPDQDAWYSDTGASFSWPLPARMTAVAISVSDDPDEEPPTATRPPVDSVVFNADDFQEGVQYVHVQFKDDEEWGAVAHHKVQIDTGSPEEVTLVVREGDIEAPESMFLVSATAEDDVSGIAKYEFFLNDQSVGEIEGAEVTQHPFTATQSGTHSFSVVAYDKAGNATRSEEITLVVGGVAGEEQGENVYVLTESELMLIVLSLIIIALGFYIIIRNHEVKLLEERLREEQEDVREESTRVFTALRNEVLTQIQNIRGKPRMTKKDQEVVDNLIKVLNVSESMLKKEMTDVEKLLK